MSVALVPLQPQANGVALFADDPAERRRMFLNLIQKNISEDQLALLFGICDRYGFDPMLKHVILIQQAMYVTRDGMRQYAHRTGLWDGIDELDKGQDEHGKWRVTVAVYRKGSSRPFVTTAYQVEHENPNSPPWQKSPYRMTFKCAELAALRMAFPVELGGAEEVGYDGVSARTNIGTATLIEGELAPDEPPPPRSQPPQRPARVALPPGKIETWDDDTLLTVCAGDYPPPQVHKATTVYFGRAANRDELLVRFKTAVRAGLSREIADPVSKAAGEALKEREPGAYQHHSREDAQPILGDTPDERLAMLARIREAMAAAGKTEEQVNRYVYAVWKQPAIELLTAEEAEELIATLEARGDEGEASAEEAVEVVAALADRPAWDDDGEPQW